MFVISVTYLQPIEAVEPHVAAHRAFLDDLIARDIVIAAGPKVPRTGGFILTSGSDREEVEAIFARDPFMVNGIARYEFTGFAPNRAAAEFIGLLEKQEEA